MPSVAIAIPNFNGENYLDETLQSLQMQVVKPDEIVFSDNYSNDRSLEIIKKFPELNIKVVRPEKFLTMSDNWNFVASKISSDWFFLLSNDDLLRNTAVKSLKEITSRLSPNFGVVSFKSEIIDENSNLMLGKVQIGKDKVREEFEFLRQNIKYLHINAASVAIKRDAWVEVGGFPTEYSVLHDLVFYQRMVLRRGILESKKVLGRYRTYSSRPDSAARSLLVANDFQTYENSDLKCYVDKYPELLGEYFSDISQKSSSNIRPTKSRKFNALCGRLLA